VRKIIPQSFRCHPSSSWNSLPFILLANELTNLVAALCLRKRQWSVPYLCQITKRWENGIFLAEAIAEQRCIKRRTNTVFP